jgi:hypothetical protein
MKIKFKIELSNDIAKAFIALLAIQLGLSGYLSYLLP